MTQTEKRRHWPSLSFSLQVVLLACLLNFCAVSTPQWVASRRGRCDAPYAPVLFPSSLSPSTPPLLAFFDTATTTKKTFHYSLPSPSVFCLFFLFTFLCITRVTPLPVLNLSRSSPQTSSSSKRPPPSRAFITMSSFLEKYNINKAVATTFGAAQAVWGWTRDRLWPIYSAAIIISLFQMIAIASEKQILADHYFGDADGTFAAAKEERVADAKKLFHEEVTVAMKEHVWQLPPAAFRREYNSRLGNA